MSKHIDSVYTAIYSGVPVYEIIVDEVAVMRRMSDSYMNATQILKVAGFAKAKRTKILERDILSGKHEKVQGGYGKYQGTWIPMATSRDLAEKYQVQDKLADLFEFDPNCDVIRTKPPKALRLAAAAVTSAPSHVLDDDALRKTPARSRTTSEAHQSPPEMQIIYQQQELTPGDHFSVPSMPFPRANSSAHSSSPLNRILFDEVTTEAEFFASVYSRRNTRSPFLEKVTDEINSIKSPVTTSIPANSEDLKRDEILMAIYVDTDERLSVARLFENLKDPSDKTKFKVDMRLDDRSSTPLHWAAACGRLGLVQYLILNGCHPSIVAYGGETALMRAAYTLRNYSNRTFPHLLKLLETSLLVKDSHKRNIVHHIAIISKATPKRAASAYYMSCIADYIFQAENPRFFISFIDSQDEYSETPLHIACRYLNYRLADILIRLGADISKENKAGETPLNMVKSDDLRMNKIFQCKKLRDKNDIFESSLFVDDYDDALTDDGSLSPLPPTPASTKQSSKQRKEKRADEILAKAKKRGSGIESRMVSQELVTASQDLTHSRTKCSNVQERFDRVQTFLEKVKPFDLSIAESVFTQGNVRFDASVLHSMGPPQSGAIFKLTNQVRRLEETLREGQSAHSKILGQFDSIATDRLVKDSHFTNEIASIFQIPEDSVEGILKVCSE